MLRTSHLFDWRGLALAVALLAGCSGTIDPTKGPASSNSDMATITRTRASARRARVAPGTKFHQIFYATVRAEHAGDACGCVGWCLPEPCIATAVQSASSLSVEPDQRALVAEGPRRADASESFGLRADFRAKQLGTFEIHGTFESKVNARDFTNHTETDSASFEADVVRPEGLSNPQVGAACETESDGLAAGVPARTVGADLMVTAQLNRDGEPVWAGRRWLEEHRPSELLELATANGSIAARSMGDGASKRVAYGFDLDAATPPPSVTVTSPLDSTFDAEIELFWPGRFEHLELSSERTDSAPRPTRRLRITPRIPNREVRCPRLVEYRVDVEPDDTCGLAHNPRTGSYETSRTTRKSLLYVSGWGRKPCEVTVRAPNLAGGSGATTATTIDFSD